MYNNEVTYNDKWNTPENKGFLKKLDDEFFHRSICSPDCPLSWSVEVYQLLKQLDKEFGIKYNNQTVKGYTITENSKLKRIFIRPFVKTYLDLIKKPKRHPKASDEAYSVTLSRYKEYRTIKNVVETFIFHISYGLSTTYAQLKADAYNFVFRPKITLSQVKEKYGTLRLYIDYPRDQSDYINNLISKTERMLSEKGAYYKLKDNG